MKKFKNKISVTGPWSLREAFIKELVALGYIKANNDYDKYDFIAVNPDHSGNIRSAVESYWTLYTLPAQWNEALKAASEVEEEVPEYYELIKEISTDVWTVGKIYKCKYPTNLEHSFNFIDDSGAPNGMSGSNYLYFKPSTKESYEAQQQELADKELLEQLIEESGLKIGDNIIIKNTNKPNSFYSNGKASNTLNTLKGWSEKPRKLQGFKLCNNSLFLEIQDVDYGYVEAEFVYKLDSKTLTLGSSNIEVKISKGKIEAGGKIIPIAYILEIINVMTNKKDTRFTWEYIGATWGFRFPSVKIGCSTFTLAELEQVVSTYNELTK